ncbi:DNA -binding domain-containing protein [Sphingomonas sp. RB1R13]|uniref:DNA -binding domain-containing protein n=1 Tax=Sphingomonas sp. RB1R13 TaxID=3096159 RepID=UPI002FC70F58
MAEAAPSHAISNHVVWSATVDHSVVSCAAEPIAPDHSDAFRIDRLTIPTTTIVGTSGSEHLSISDGMKRIRLDVVSGTLLQGSVKLHYRLAGFENSEAQMLTLQRLLALHRLGRFSRRLHPREPKAERWVMMLRAHDLSTLGASQRDIAGVLFGPDVVGEWRTRSDFLRLRVQRLLRDANGMIGGGYLDLLRGSHDLRSDASR